MINCAKYYSLVLVAMCCIVWAACTQQRQLCLTPKIAVLNVEFLHEQTDSSTVPVDTAFPAAIFTALTDRGGVATIYPQQSTFALSLSPVANVCRWVFTTDSVQYNKPYDTLTFYYQRDLQFLSNACGYTYFYTLDSVQATHYNIDSLRITNTSVTNNVNPKHLQIFIHTQF